jgi:hypothetical protein
MFKYFTDIMKKIIFSLTFFISILVMNAAILSDRLFHKESYGAEFYGNSTPLSKTFEDVCVINWTAKSYFGGRNVVVSFTLSGAETANETFSLLNQYSLKSGSVGNASNPSNYNLRGSVTCNGSYSDASGMISFDTFTTELN